jgi:hypothetical protein
MQPPRPILVLGLHLAVLDLGLCLVKLRGDPAAARPPTLMQPPRPILVLGFYLVNSVYRCCSFLTTGGL